MRGTARRGIEVWFDQSELRGGDAWDQSIRRQIKTARCSSPSSPSTRTRGDEGYFRLEWKLAVDRSHLMTANKAFLVPVVIDDTRDDDENVPGAVPGGAVDTAARRARRPRPSSNVCSACCRRSRRHGAVRTSRRPARGHSAAGARIPAVKAVAARIVACWSSRRIFARTGLGSRSIRLPTRRRRPAAAASAHAAAAAFTPPPHSIAVLPFVNMSGDKEQEYFSDGLTEELLNSLAEINELQVAARTSAFSFKGKDTDIGTIARKLNVGAVLEGSVRRSGHTIRITAQLINAVTGFHLWSKTYDRDLGDVLKLQTEIATAVAGLKVTLLGDVAAKIELGGTRNPAAFDAYLRASQERRTGTEARTIRARLPRTQKRSDWTRTMRSRSRADRSL